MNAGRSIYSSACNFNDFVFDIFGVPIYHLAFELLLVIWLIRVILGKRYSPPKPELSEKEQEELVADWKPEPLVPDDVENPEGLQSFLENTVSGKPTKYIDLQEKHCLNTASYNFLDLNGRPEIEEVAISTISRYGVGSCGPRGFYGTLDVHLDLEEKLAKFSRCEEAILYSYGFSTIASAIPAYAKRGDVIFCDEGVHYAIQKGLEASRSKLRWFRHNDMEHLEQLLKAQAEEDKTNPKKAAIIRRFIVVEGLYVNYGDVCPLKKLVELKYKYKVRIVMDESYSFATLGATGRGVTELLGVDIEDVDLISGSLETSLASTGGFCIGSTYVVDHQRLSGHGYCFSASLPPLLANAAHKALEIIEENPTVFDKLKNCSMQVHNALTGINGITVGGEKMSPIKHIYLADSTGDRKTDVAILEEASKQCLERGVAVVVARYLDSEHKLPKPSLRISVNVNYTEDEISRISSAIALSVDLALRKYEMKNNPSNGTHYGGLVKNGEIETPYEQ